MYKSIIYIVANYRTHLSKYKRHETNKPFFLLLLQQSQWDYITTKAFT